MNILYFLPSKQSFFPPLVWCFINSSSRFPPSVSDNRTCLQAPAHAYGRRVTGNKLTLYFIGLTSWQTLSRCAGLAMSLTPVCLNISSAVCTPVSLTGLLLSLHGKARRAPWHTPTKAAENIAFNHLLDRTDWHKINQSEKVNTNVYIESESRRFDSYRDETTWLVTDYCFSYTNVSNTVNRF